jgi:hypothetical protein
MKTNLLFITTLLACSLFVVESKAQNVEDLKKEKRLKLKEAKQNADKSFYGFGYYGGTQALIGVNFYVMNPKKLGFYASIRGASEKGEDYAKTYEIKPLSLNVGVTKNLFYPVGMYVAAGVGMYEKYNPGKYGSEIDSDSWIAAGAETSAGLIFHVIGVELQGGVSLVNFKHPDVTFGIGFNWL